MSADHEPDVEDLFAGFGKVTPSAEASARAVRETRAALITQSRTPLAQPRRRLIQCPSASVAMIVCAWAGVCRAVRSVALGSSDSQNPLPRRWIASARIGAAFCLLAAVVGGVYLVGALTENHAFADVQKSLERVKSITFTLRRTDGDHPEEIAKVMLLGEDRARLELSSGEVVISDRSVGKTLRVIPEEEKGVWLSETSNEYEFIVNLIRRLRNAPREDVSEIGQDGEGPMLLGPYSASRLPPSYCIYGGGRKTVVYVDPDTHLPTRVLWGPHRDGDKRFHVFAVFRTVDVAHHDKVFRTDLVDGEPDWELVDMAWRLPQVASEFVYNADLDPALFSLTQPVVSPVELRKEVE